MLNKPDILKGSVKSFIGMEYKWFTVKDETQDWYNYRGFNDTLRRFYSQSFQPEMIEYFEGWIELITEDQKADGIIWRYQSSKNNVCAYGDNEFWINKEPCISIPQTLDQFITDCLRASIILQWREK